MSKSDSSFGFPWFLIAGIWFANGLFGGDDDETKAVPSKPVAAQVAAKPADPEPPMSEEEPWDPDKALEGVTDADELFKDTFAGVSDPFE